MPRIWSRCHGVIFTKWLQAICWLQTPPNLNWRVQMYVYLEPVCPLFWGLNPPKEGPVHSKQGSFGFQVYSKCCLVVVFVFIMRISKYHKKHFVMHINCNTRCTSSICQSIRKLIYQWLFLVPLKGGRWHINHIIPHLAGFFYVFFFHLY